MKINVLYKTSLFMLVLYGWGMGSLHAHEKVITSNQEEKLLIEVLDEISREHQVYFTYDSDIIKGVTVDYERKEGESVRSILSRVLAEVNMDFKIFEERFVILYRKDEAGLKSLEQMISHMEEIVKDRKELFANRRAPAVARLNSEKWSDVNRMRLVLNVTGRVMDAKGEPLIGVNILVKGTNKGTTTDIDGRFSLTDLDDQAVLVVSYVGYKSQEITLDGKTSLTIVMLEDALTLDEVVVVGYGTARRKDISGAVSTVRLEDSPISFSPNTHLLQALHGVIAGVNVGAQNSPGSNPGVLVRGQNSIYGSNDPLIVLDGIVYLGSISDINPDDIAVMDVLKDASAAAVYGSRAANGVIVITTKEGKTDKPVIKYNTSFGLNNWPSPPNMMNRERWTAKYIAQKSISSPNEIVFDASYATELWKQGVDIDWIPLVSRNGFMQNHQVAVSGRGDRIDYYFSGGYNSHEGVIIGDDYQRISVRTRLGADITDWLEVGLDGTYNNNDYSGIGADVGSAYSISPWYYPYRYEGMPENPGSNKSKLLERFPGGASVQNPLWGTDGTIESKDIRNFFRLGTHALFRVPKVEGLTYQFNLAINSNFDTRDSFIYEDYYVGGNISKPYFAKYSAGELFKRLVLANGYKNRYNDYSYVMDHIINYKKEFADHYVDATLVATRDYSIDKLVGATGSDYSTNGNTLLGIEGIHKASVQKVNLNVVERANIGYLGRLGYAYQDKYHLTASIRRDGASVFGEDQKWGLFSSVGVAWTVSEENFLSEIEKLNYLKVKASYGRNGNQGLKPYQTLARVASGSDGGIRYEFGEAPSTILYGVDQSNLGSPSLGWEVTTAFNGGFQSAWFNNRVFLDLDYYFSKTTDQIFARQIPIMTGFNSIFSSLGQVDNKGIEISLRTSNLEKNDFKWSSGLIYWQNRNKIVSLYGDDIDGDGKEDDDLANGLFIGKSLGAIYGYEYIGVVQEDDTDYITNTGAKPGDPMFKDLGGPDGGPDGIISADFDRKILGFRKENFRLSLSNNIEYKTFNLYILLSGIFGGSKDNYYLKENPRYNSFRDRFDTNEIDHDWWTPENKSEKYLRADAFSTRYLGLQSRGFLRIQDVNLSYTLPRGFFSSIGVNSLELYSSINNLYTFTNWFGGGDPEEGVRPDDGTYPVPRTYSVGLKVGF